MNILPGGLGAHPLSVVPQGGMVLFQGDSITDGGRGREGSDLNHSMGQSYAYLVAAAFGAEFPERNIAFVNRGIGGDRVADLAARWQCDTLALRPALLSILVGVNDAISRKGRTPARAFEETYDRLLAGTLEALPAVKIVLGEPFLLPSGPLNEEYASRLAAVRDKAETVARLAARYSLPLIPYQQAMDAACLRAPAGHWCWDGIHPTYAGHGLMAREWLKTVNRMQPPPR